MQTHFAPAERADAQALAILARETVASPVVRALLESIEGFVMILDSHRQVLAVNDELLRFLGCSVDGALVGLRPGEGVRCIHATEGPGGCGTARVCSLCGAVLAILASQAEGQAVEGECRLTYQREEGFGAAEFRVRAAPLRLGPHTLTCLVLVDISSAKRREVLESLFLHDISNTIQGLWAIGETLQAASLDPETAGRMILELSRRMKREINGHRLLQAAESGTYSVKLEKLSIQALFQELEALYDPLARARRQTLLIHPPEPDQWIPSDSELLTRILENMITNALEASPAEAGIQVRFQRKEDRFRFQVHNPGTIAEEVALRIFQRSFSTKATQGRGLGTFSMKLFGESYLGGAVAFRSAEGEGTTFTLELPGAEG